MAKTRTSFKPGQSGNPGGRPSRVRKELADLLSSEFTDAKRREVFRSLIADATDDDPDIRLPARALLLAYAFGKPVERKEQAGELRIVVVDEDDSSDDDSDPAP